ncbi:MAG: acyl-ACP--UDP-N-acetylglucosamine O-acyltransferase [Pseudomonadota bacterium]|nr:acyl-ACP--UDP-N-acetylglucosamine O-acyltransferase [Pseudomonadota bacterium]
MIHPTAIVNPAARLAADVAVGPWTLIGPGVEVGAGTVIGPHVVITRDTRIGENNRIFQFATLGEDCQDKKYAGELTHLVIGDHNVIREGCTLHRGTVQDRGVTEVGNHNLFMNYVHIAHDCRVGDHTILANNATLGGHVQVDNWCILGGYTAVHQFGQIGAHAFCGAGSLVLKDVPAYVTVNGNPAKPHGINTEGLKRRGFDPETINALRRAYRILYRQGLTLEDSLRALEELAVSHPAVIDLIRSLRASTRGVVR